MTVSGSKLSANTATSLGGGIYSPFSAGAVKLSGSSAYVMGNTANSGNANSGGGIYIYSGTLSGVTIHVTGNSPNNITAVS